MTDDDTPTSYTVRFAGGANRTIRLFGGNRGDKYWNIENEATGESVSGEGIRGLLESMERIGRAGSAGKAEATGTDG